MQKFEFKICHGFLYNFKLPPPPTTTLNFGPKMSEKLPKTLNTCLIGFGFAGRTFHAPLLVACPAITLGTIVTSRPEQVQTHFAETTGKGQGTYQINTATDLTTAIEQNRQAGTPLDLVVIATPNDTHYPLAKTALQAGINVVVDKPFTIDLTEAQSLNQIATAQKTILTVFQNRRFDADFLTVQKLLADDTLGEISHFESHFDRYRPQPQDRWRETNTVGGGLWYDLGSHILDQAITLFGRPEAIFADLLMQRPGGKTVDYFQARLAYGNMRVVLSASTLVSTPNPRFTIHGARGSYVKCGLDTQENSLKQGLAPNHPDFGIDPDPGVLHTISPTDNHHSTSLIPNQKGRYIDFYAQVANAILLDQPPPVLPQEAVDLMAIIDKGIASSRDGRWHQV